MTSAFGGQHSIQLSYGCVRFIFGRAGHALRGFAAAPGRRSLPPAIKKTGPACKASLFSLSNQQLTSRKKSGDRISCIFDITDRRQGDNGGLRKLCLNRRLEPVIATA